MSSGADSTLTDVEQLLVGSDGVGLAAEVRSGALDAKELLGAAIGRIERLDPKLNAVVVRLFDRARDRVDEAVATGGPFAGVPFLLKDMMDDLEGVPTSKGNRALSRFPAAQNSELVDRYLAAGVSVLGKTNTPEFGLQAVTEPELWGPTRNPWNTDHTPGGSSGGSAAAVAAGLVPLAAAGDGGGSIRIPASYCGLFGLKPSRGRMPLGPTMGEAWYGAAQPLVVSRSVRDTAVMLDAVHGSDVGVSVVAPPVDRPYAEVIAGDPPPLRIALSVESPIGTPVDADNRAAAELAAQLLEAEGHEIVERAAPIDGRAIAESYITMYFGDVAATVAEIEDLLGRKATADDVELTTLALAGIGRTISAGEFSTALRSWGLAARSMGAFFEEVDLYLTPTTAMPPAHIGELKPTEREQQQIRLALKLRAWRAVLKTGMIDELVEQNLSRTPFTQIANIAGLPAMSVPLHHHANGLPCGAHVIGPYGREDRLLAVAAQLERVAPWHERRADV